MLKKIGAKFSSAIILASLMLPAWAQAQILPSCDPIPKPAPAVAGKDFCGVEDLFQLLINIYNFLLGIAGLLLLLMLIWGGVRMLIFYISETPDKDLEAAKYTVRRAITGFVIIAMAYLIVNTVLVLLGFNDGSEVGKLLHTYFQ
jgi:hypothetical protein